MTNIELLCAAARDFYRFGWMPGTAGNLSVRSEDGESCLVSISGRHKGRLVAADFVNVPIAADDFSAIEPRPSAETAVHNAIYRRVADAGAVLHAHCPYVALLSHRTSSITLHDYENIKGLGVWDRDAVEVPVVPNHREIPRLADAVGARIDAGVEVPGVFVAAHGLYAWGRDVDEAQRHIESFEYLCRLAWEERA